MKFRTAERLQNTDEYYFSKKLDEVRKLKSQGIDVINLGIGSPDLVPSRQTMDAAVKAIQSDKGHGYAPYRSSPELRQALAAWYKRLYNVTLEPNSEILPLLGSKEGILYTALAFVNPGEKILIPNPGYPAYTSVTKLIGAQVETYDLLNENDWLPDFNELEKKDLKNCKIMWVNYPHMPTGRRAEKKTFLDLIEFAKSRGILLCHDNPYGLVLNEEKPMSILQFDPKMETCVEFNSFSKAFNMAGWRVGMAAGHKDVIDAILTVKSNVDSGMFTAIQAGAMAALENPESWHEERNNIYQERRKIVFKIFDALGFKYDPKQVGLFVWAKAPESVSEIGSFIDQLLYEARVFLVPGFVFGSNGKRFARSSLCAPVETLNEALSRVKAWKENKK
jgi:LL-diaminopimelate aminotransferase